MQAIKSIAFTGNNTKQNQNKQKRKGNECKNNTFAALLDTEMQKLNKV